jgi:hypothetical protein
MSGERVVSGPFSLCLESGAVTKLPPPYPWGFFLHVSTATHCGSDAVGISSF